MAVDKRTQKRLRDGIAAAQAGRREQGRALLLRVLEQAGDVEEAWWWLSQATDDPAERQQALQKVVSLNPDHPEAGGQLVELRLQRLPSVPSKASATSPPAAEAWSDRLPRVTLEEDDGVDNPFQCPYCGEATSADDTRCPYCRGNLYRRVAVSGNSEPLRGLLLVLGIGLALGLLELAAPLMALGSRLGSATPANYAMLLQVPGVQPFLGNFLQWGPVTATWLLRALLARTAIYAALIFGLRARWSLAYYGTMLVVLADVLLSLYLLVAGYLGWAGLVLNMVLIFAAGLMLFGVSYEFAVNHERLLVRPDSAARGPLDFFRRGHYYRGQGMWALAVAQWRRAVGLAPHEGEYYKDLGIGYAQIGRYDRGLRALQEAQRRSPNPDEIAKIIAVVEAEARRERAGGVGTAGGVSGAA